MNSKIIAIAGGSGSGKSLLAEFLAQDLLAGRAALLQHDRYYFGRAQFPAGEQPNFDIPSSLDNALLASHLAALKSGQRIAAPMYDFPSQARQAATDSIEPTEFIIFEGIFALSVPELWPLFDCTIFVDTEPDIRLVRRLIRNETRKARPLLDDIVEYLKFVKPGFDQFVASARSRAEFVLANNDSKEAFLAESARILAARFAAES